MMRATFLNDLTNKDQTLTHGRLVQYSQYSDYSRRPLNLPEDLTAHKATRSSWRSSQHWGGLGQEGAGAPQRDEGYFGYLNKVELAVEHSHYSDEELLQLIAQRDANALSEIYDRHAQTAYNLIMRIVREQSAAEDLLQETFWQVWEKASTFSGRGVAGAWIYRIARNKSLDHLRRQKARPDPTQKPISEQIDLSEPPKDVNLTSVEISVEQTLQRERVQDALASIPPEQRECLELAYFDGMSQRQIAEYTDTPLGTIKTRVRQGLKKVERILRAVGFGPVNMVLFLFFVLVSLFY